ALPCVATALGVSALAAGALGFATRALRRGDLPRSVIWSYAAYAAAICLAARLILPVVDRWQDLPALAARIHADTLREPFALLDPDETTIAMLDHDGARFEILTSGAAAPPATVGAWFAAQGPAARVLVLLPGHAGGPVTAFLAHRLPHPAAPGDGVAGALAAAGAARIALRYELPEGRRYALLAPPAQH
ncbi:MAG TPA: hypothetical protein VGR80_13150, partial [Steroidobacteraceae bacterium]|nr:hypothetical protein [Steroidobacteraceae bacterium]